MNLSLSIFDVFATAIPGVLYLAAGLYLGVRFGWIELGDLAGLDTTLAAVGAFLASYLLGHALGPSLRQLGERIPVGQKAPTAASREFAARNPGLASRPFLDLDPHTLLAGLRQVSPQAATGVDRNRAIGVMLRSASPAFGIGAAVALGELVLTGHPAAGVLAVALVVVGALSLREGHKFGHWARIHTLECAAWIGDLDARLGPVHPPGGADPGN